MKRIKSMSFVMLAIAMIISLNAAFAANVPETLTTTATIEIEKTLDPSDGVYPDVDTFTFTLEKYSYTLASDNVTVTDDITYMPAGGSTTVTVTEDGDVKTGSTTFDIDFSSKAAGVYTYKVTEVSGTVNGVTYDGEEFYVEVYVINQVDENNIPTGETTIANVLAYNATDGKTALESSVEGYISISIPFENTYETSASILLSKTVKGNYANTEQYFDFIVTLDDGQTTAGTYSIVYYDADGNVIDAPNSDPTTITSGVATTISLKHGQTFEIVELPACTTYSIVEDQLATYSGEYVIDGEEAVTPSNATGSASTGDTFTMTGTLADNGMNNGILSDETIDVTNTREYTVPTGIIITVLPFACGLALIAVFLVLSSRKREEQE